MKLLMILASCYILVSSVASANVWHIETLDYSWHSIRGTSLALDEEDHAHISYWYCDIVNDAQLKYAYWNGSSWEISLIDTGSPGDDIHRKSSIALDPWGHPRIAYTDIETEELRYASWNGSSWVITIVSTESPMSVGCALCIDSENRPSIAFHAIVFLYYAIRIGSIWDVSLVDNDYEVGLLPSMDLDSNDKPHISYYDGLNRSLKYAYLGPEFWHIFTIDDSGDNVGSWSSIALDNNDRPHIVYFDNTNYALKYAYYDGSSWNISTITTGVLGHSSIAIDDNDYPNVAYYSSTGDNLKYAHWNGFSWVISVVDDGTGQVGYNPSLAFDSEYNPHISYAARGPDVLKYAYYGLEGIEEEEGGPSPDGFALYNANPNPCPGCANISFSLPVSSDVNLDVYDITGRKVAVLAEGVFSTGLHEVEISGLANGIYLCALRVGDFVDIKTIVVIK